MPVNQIMTVGFPDNVQIAMIPKSLPMKRIYVCYATKKGEQRRNRTKEFNIYLASTMGTGEERANNN